MNEEWFFQWEQVVLMLEGKNRRRNERGYALLESLVGLMLLSIVSMSLIVVLPILLEEHARLDTEQAIYHKLLELHATETRNNVFVTEPFSFEAFRHGYEWCAIYRWRDGNEKTICL